MSVHSNHYEDPDEYERDLAWEYRTEGRVRTRKRKNIPFYDEPNEMGQDFGDYPDTIPNQFDNMTGSMNL